MGLPRRVDFMTALKYRGGVTMSAWMLLHITGIGMLVLITGHVATGFFMQQMGSQVSTNPGYFRS